MVRMGLVGAVLAKYGVRARAVVGVGGLGALPGPGPDLVLA